MSVAELAALPGCAASGARYPFVQTALALRKAAVPRAALGRLAADALGVRPGPGAACGPDLALKQLHSIGLMISSCASLGDACWSSDTPRLPSSCLTQ